MPKQPAPKPRRLTRSQLESIRQVLVEQREKLGDHLASWAKAPREPRERAVSDAAEMASTDVEQGLAGQLGGVMSAAVAEIDHALAKMEASAYGVCEECGERIPYERLKALPSATLCVACKQRLETERGGAGLGRARGELLGTGADAEGEAAADDAD